MFSVFYRALLYTIIHEGYARMENDFLFTELPIEIQVSTLEYLTAKDIARLIAVSKEWQELLKCDPIWRALGYRKYGQYVGEIPTKQELEEYSAQIGENITHIHWLQYRRLFGFYKGLLSASYNLDTQSSEDGYKAELSGVIHYNNQSSWRTCLKIDFLGTNEKENFGSVVFPVIKMTQAVEPLRFNINGRIFKARVYLYVDKTEIYNSLGQIQAANYLPSDVFDNTKKFKQSHVELSSKLMPKLFWDDNLFLLSPYTYDAMWNEPYQLFTYKVDKICDYINTIAQNFQVIDSQLQLYLAEIVSGFEYLNKNNILFRVTIPAMKADGHLQFMAASHPWMHKSMCSYFGLSPELPSVETNLKKHPPRDLQRSDYYLLGVFMLHVATGRELVMTPANMRSVTRVSVPNHLSVDLQTLLTSLLEEKAELRPKSIVAIKRSAYFKGINWNKMAKQDWTPKYKPNI